MQDGRFLQSGATWLKVTSNKVRPAGNPDDTKKDEYSKWKQDGLVAQSGETWPETSLD